MGFSKDPPSNKIVVRFKGVWLLIQGVQFDRQDGCHLTTYNMLRFNPASLPTRFLLVKRMLFMVKF